MCCKKELPLLGKLGKSKLGKLPFFKRKKGLALSVKVSKSKCQT